MAKGALTGERLLTKNIPQFIGGIVEGQWVGTPEKLGWRSIGSDVLYYETYFDLGAYTMDDLTAYPLLLELQDGMPYYSDKNDGWLNVVDIISQEKLDPITDFLVPMTELNIAGLPETKQDFTQILMANYRLFSPQVDFTATNLYLPATAGSFGSNEPTAVEKLWLYRFISFSGNTPWTDGTTLQIPATRFIAAIDVRKEDDLPYMMRLKRSFELGTD